ncbi:hypothetical protein Lalb_Chr21g0317481 [Lupinus albus]|uniref:Uncharacterized protein n=1 Tax=Lupinus albus TaxID=3870 RepID=A0A6A4NHI6_LUPAL|nr:hypothetical protein Lalb_Chr21g0317481 [Lupinus albus]
MCKHKGPKLHDGSIHMSFVHICLYLINDLNNFHFLSIFIWYIIINNVFGTFLKCGARECNI